MRVGEWHDCTEWTRRGFGNCPVDEEPLGLKFVEEEETPPDEDLDWLDIIKRPVEAGKSLLKKKAKDAVQKKMERHLEEAIKDAFGDRTNEILKTPMEDWRSRAGAAAALAMVFKGLVYNSPQKAGQNAALREAEKITSRSAMRAQLGRDAPFGSRGMRRSIVAEITPQKYRKKLRWATNRSGWFGEWFYWDQSDRDEDPWTPSLGDPYEDPFTQDESWWWSGEPPAPPPPES